MVALVWYRYSNLANHQRCEATDLLAGSALSFEAINKSPEAGTGTAGTETRRVIDGSRKSTARLSTNSTLSPRDTP